jgi:hypothetical protein
MTNGKTVVPKPPRAPKNSTAVPFLEALGGRMGFEPTVLGSRPRPNIAVTRGNQDFSKSSGPSDVALSASPDVSYVYGQTE